MIHQIETHRSQSVEHNGPIKGTNSLAAGRTKTSQATDPFSEVRYFFRMIDFAKEIGRPSNAAHCVKRIEQIFIGPMDVASMERLASAKDWVVWAMDYERRHGKESLLDRTHPIHLRALEMVRRR